MYKKEYSTVTGLFVLTLIIAMLLSTPGTILARQATFIDSELSHASGHEVSVRLKMDIGSTEYMAAFPTQIGDWKSGTEYDMSKTGESLGADLMLARAYSRQGVYPATPIFFMITRSSNRSSFHPPIVCYPALGYTIEEEARENIIISNISWMESIFGTSKQQDINHSISVKKLVVTKESDGEVRERRVVLYFYVKDNPLVSNMVTMLRVSALIPLHGPIGSSERILDDCKEFISDTIPYMFEFPEKNEDVIAVSLVKSGIGGCVLIAALVLLPLLIIIYPMIRRHYLKNQ
ncbi:MAG: exosortase-associated EpsI family protein [Methanosarcinales archaeon]|uniref:Exosortase-associated EpsI family protein n=1 Tax=Candidatus Ethanoperedens thermophilum TaxID=2766897 RepID=A0A848D9X7_9EURY|nr:exosortase-associated EpsI family protein [Candidatus Ethanoperedens thermophilum]